MHGRRLGLMLSVALTLALCCEVPNSHAQSGRVRRLHQPEMRASGLSGREVQTRAEVAPERLNETKAATEVNHTGNSTLEVRELNKGRRAPVAHSLDPEHITFAIIMGMIVLILVSGRV
jgi:hypothetical protein